MGIFATAGDRLFIGGVLDAKSGPFVEADFTAALTAAVEVKGIGNLGMLGDDVTLVEYDIITEGRTQNAKGTRKASTMEIEAALQVLDPGQVAIREAEATGFDYAFRLELNDKPSAGSSPKNSTRLFIAKVMKAQENFGGPNDVTKLMISLQPNCAPVRVAASAT